MRALICHEYAGIDSLTFGELPDPQPTPGHVLVDVKAAAVNFADSLLVAGQYQMKPDLPFAPGSEVAGIVVDAGGMEGLAVGDRVCGFPGVGGMAERVLIPGPATVRIPEAISFQDASTVPVAYGTSYHALVDRGQAQPGETVLILGAAGGVGLAAVQIGKALGATVLAGVSSEEKADVARESGADHVIRYDQVAIRDGIAEATGGGGVDIVYDPVGGDLTEQALRSTRWQGRLLVVGFASGTIPSIPLNLTLVKGVSIVGVFWGRHFTEAPDEETANFRQIISWLGDGTIRPLVQKTYPLSDAAEAIQWVASRKAIGRVVIVP